MRIVFSSLLFLLVFQIQAQILEPVKWDFQSKNIGGDEFELTMIAKLDQGWSTYSQHTSDDGPVPTYFEFKAGDHFDLIGKVEELSKKKEGMDPLFGVTVIKFTESPVIFKQKVKVKDYSKPITGYLTYMTCDDARCLPPTDVDIEYSLTAPAGGTGASTSSTNTSTAVAETKIQTAQPKPQPKPQTTTPTVVTTPTPTTAAPKTNVEVKETKPEPKKTEKIETTPKVVKQEKAATTNATIAAEEEAQKVLAPKTETKSNTAGTFACNFKMEGDVIDQSVPAILSTYKNPIGDCGAENVARGQSLFWTFIMGFLGGLVALLTPCVFPMIPLTVSYFTKSSKDRASGIRNALWYGASIIIIYVAIGLLITAVFGAGALQQLSTDWIANTLFFLIFVFFAFSFFGYYEITLPASWSNKTDRAADQGGLLGIFFMAFTLALVSFSCTGPIIGSALVESATNKLGPFIVMLGFSSALALPFGLFAAFPSWLNSLPKSGGWMNSVKVVLGFLELALALKFLSVADMTMGWGILPYEVFMGAWVILFGLTTAYLLGFFKFPHDSPVQKISPVRGTFAALFGALTIYLASGFMIDERSGMYDSLGLMSGLAPPAKYNLFLAKAEVDEDLKKRFPSFGKCANNLDCFKDYCEGMAYAKETGKPVLVDFTGHGCVNCRKTEEHIWVDDRIWSKLQNDFILISLYTDERTKLKKTLISKKRKKKLRNVGTKWGDFEIVNFDQNSQPLYVMMTPDEKVLAAPRGYVEGTSGYNDYLECGLSTFENLD